MKRTIAIVLAALAWWACTAPTDEARPAGDTSPHPVGGIPERKGLDQPSAQHPSGPREKRILFGDLHVHTTISADAYILSLPVLQGEGAHPPADACDYARFCSKLDFWSINDHAESISPRNWKVIKDSIRQCNALAGDPDSPDTVAFLGWEWSQAGATAAEHFGHKNVIFKDIEEGRVPTRPISALTPQVVAAMQTGLPLWQRLSLVLFDAPNIRRYLELGRYQKELQSTPLCPPGVDVRDLPEDCLESAVEPAELFEKLRQWGFDSIVIPHGTAWGIYTPPASSWDKQLVGARHDPERQTLIEVYSGHGSSEVFRPWRPVSVAENGDTGCPDPTPEYEPCCWRAGEIIRSRCNGLIESECEERVRQARKDYAAAGIVGHLTIPGARVEEWKECGQCRDCFAPAFNYRPTASAQYALAISNFDDAEAPRRFRFGFIASSDNHRARPGTGFKESDRRGLTEAAGPRSEFWRRNLMLPDAVPVARSRPFEVKEGMLPFHVWETERQASFFMTGGLVAAHATGRDRDSIWEALKRREVYATSGDRILLWFDLLNGRNGPAPMGSEVSLDEPPRFRIRALGARVQKPGCPDGVGETLSADELERLCRGECHHPGDRRHPIVRLEVVRIRPQRDATEEIASLIDDPWHTTICPADGSGCTTEIVDSEFPSAGRETIYYVRAIQEATPAVNAGGLRCSGRDRNGSCTTVNPCWGDYRTPPDDDCLALHNERAWSSPIYVAPGAQGPATAASPR